MAALDEYFAAWVANDPDRIAAAVTPDCVIIESYGPVYRGQDRVRQWAGTWFAAGGIVHSWRTTHQFSTGDRVAAEWVFECTWQGNRTSFDGATIALVADGLIANLREYQTTAELYDWTGTWE